MILFFAIRASHRLSLSLDQPPPVTFQVSAPPAQPKPRQDTTTGCAPDNSNIVHHTLRLDSAAQSYTFSTTDRIISGTRPSVFWRHSSAQRPGSRCETLRSHALPVDTHILNDARIACLDPPPRSTAAATTSPTTVNLLPCLASHLALLCTGYGRPLPP